MTSPFSIKDGFKYTGPPRALEAKGVPKTTRHAGAYRTTRYANGRAGNARAGNALPSFLQGPLCQIVPDEINKKEVAVQPHLAPAA